MIRLIVGFVMTIGAVGGMELYLLTPINTLFFVMIGFILILSPIKDGSIYRLIGKI